MRRISAIIILIIIVLTASGRMRFFDDEGVVGVTIDLGETRWTR